MGIKNHFQSLFKMLSNDSVRIASINQILSEINELRFVLERIEKKIDASSETEDPDKKLSMYKYTKKEFANIVHTTPGTVQRWIAAHKVDAIMIGGRWMINSESILKGNK